MACSKGGCDLEREVFGLGGRFGDGLGRTVSLHCAPLEADKNLIIGAQVGDPPNNIKIIEYFPGLIINFANTINAKYFLQQVPNLDIVIEPVLPILPNNSKQRYGTGGGIECIISVKFCVDYC